MRLGNKMRDKTAYLKPLEAEPVSGDTVKLVGALGGSEKWPDPVNQDWSYQTTETESEEEPSEPLTPWEEHRTQGREALRIELQQLETHSIRAAKWAEAQTDLPDGLLTDIRTVAEKLRQMMRTLSK